MFEFSKRSKIVVITTPVDTTTEFFQRKTNHSEDKVFGFGGSLDESRLKYLIDKYGKTTPKNYYFLGIHGSKGIPILPDKTKNSDKIKRLTKNYYQEIVKRTGESTKYGPARKLSEFTSFLKNPSGKTINASVWNSKYKMFTTWPFQIKKSGKVKLTEIELSSKNKAKLDNLLEEELGERREFLRKFISD